MNDDDLIGNDELTLNVVGPSDDSTEPGAWHLTVSGELDIETAPRLVETIDAMIARGATLVVVDASNVQFMDSSGIRAIVQSGKHLRAAGGQLLIDGMSGAVQRVLEIAGLLEQYRR